MKVQIEIPLKAAQLAKYQVLMSANSEDDQCKVEQAFERCNDEVTEINLDEYDDDMMIRIVLAFAAIVQQGERIEQEEEKE